MGLVLPALGAGSQGLVLVLGFDVASYQRQGLVFASFSGFSCSRRFDSLGLGARIEDAIGATFARRATRESMNAGRGRRVY